MFLHKNRQDTVNQNNQNVPEIIVPSVPNIIISSKRFSLSLGINDYPGTQNDLKGCVNDAKNWFEVLTTIYNFKAQMLLDSQATKGRVVEILGNYMRDSKSGENYVITGSSHGTSIPDINSDEFDGKDEAICLHDSLLIDDDFRAIINQLHPEASLMIVSDSCFSGSVTRAFLASNNKKEGLERIPKYLPPSDVVEAAQLIALPTKKRMFFQETDMREILLSGCKDNEYSYDTRLGGSPCGALSYFATKAIREKPDATYEEFYATIRKSLPNNDYNQTPQLEGSALNKKKILFT
jgi:metacaspase-1